jgi:Ca-activated chloride channel homolog
MTFSVRSDRTLIRPRWHSNRFVVVDITAPVAPRTGQRPPVNLSFVLDRSGSMGGDRIVLAAKAVEEGIARLQPEDRFSIVVYDTAVDTVMPSTLATVSARSEAMTRLRAIHPRGSTDLGSGWLRGCEQVAAHLLEGGVNRALLLTDGLANVGITDRSELARHAGELRARGVSTSTFGVGDHFDEALLQAMADEGGGQFHDIGTAAAIVDHITSEVGETLEVVAHDAVLELTMPEGVRVESLSRYPIRDSGGRSDILLGDLVSDQQVQVVLRLSFPFGEIGGTMPAVLAVSDRDGVLAERSARLAWQYATDRENDAQPRDREVDRIVARVFAARTRQAAVAMNRQGDFQGARSALEATARKIRGYAGSDAELKAVGAALMDEAEQMASSWAPRALKELYAQGQYDLKLRDHQGRARRSMGPRDA